MRNEIRCFRVERILNITRTSLSFRRPGDFSARAFLMNSLFPEPADSSRFTPLIIEGRSEALDDLCIHWFMEHYLQERTLTQATFLVEQESLYTHIPYIVLRYGKSVQVIEPQNLKSRLVEIASELMEYYKG
ncbi:helix-turn-helix transcriptional regulator [Paenibacillus spiritus]|uniref:helix-turn-helix transcriptional regulator n=1 Tax=Paenibacillus spiritus TaxID=2496557 RepID=UPI001CC35E5A|nr:WYL domain-containing protein [Paenibacillus spiritus]